MYRILVVEDDEVIAKTIRQHLQSWNYEVFAREFDTLKSKKVPQSLEIGLFFCQIFIFIV